MKKTIFLLSFIIGMMVNAQVSQTQVFATTEEIHFVSDDGGGMYTISGPGAGDDGFLAIYDENNSSWEVKDFPPKTNYGSYHNAEVVNAITINGVTFSTGVVATSNTSEWEVVRKYIGTNFSVEKTVENVSIKLYKAGGNIYGAISIYSNSNLLNSGWSLSGIGQYLVKINQQDLSLDWSYQICSSWNNGEWRIDTQDYLIPTNVAYRYAVQHLPNGNIALSVHRTSGMESELWEFDPNTGQKLGVIDDSYTDYDRDGVAEMQYRFHRWKIIDGVLFHEFWNDPNNSQDAQIGHWEKLEIPGYTPEGSGSGQQSTTAWTSAGLQITAVSDWGVHDSFRKVFIDPWVDASGKLRWNGFYLSENLSLYKNEVADITGGDGRDEWTRPNGERMVMTLHSLLRVIYNEQFPNHIEVINGNNVVEARNNEFYKGTSWESRSGESTVVVAHSAMPQDGDNPDPSWWSIPSGFHYTGNTPIEVSHRSGEEGMLFFRVGAVEDGGSSYPSELILRVWVVDANTVSVLEMEVSGLKLYPNPVQDYLTVSADDTIDTIRIYNLLEVIVSESNSNSVYMGNLTHGVYIAEVISGDKMSRKKVIKK